MKHSFVSKNEVFNYSLFAGKKVFPDPEEILSVLSEAFDEAFLWEKRRLGWIKSNDDMLGNKRTINAMIHSSFY